MKKWFALRVFAGMLVFSAVVSGCGEKGGVLIFQNDLGQVAVTFVLGESQTQEVITNEWGQLKAALEADEPFEGAYYRTVAPGGSVSYTFGKNTEVLYRYMYYHEDDTTLYHTEDRFVTLSGGSTETVVITEETPASGDAG